MTKLGLGDHSASASFLTQEPALTETVPRCALLSWEAPPPLPPLPPPPSRLQYSKLYGPDITTGFKRYVIKPTTRSCYIKRCFFSTTLSSIYQVARPR